MEYRENVVYDGVAVCACSWHDWSETGEECLRWMNRNGDNCRCRCIVATAVSIVSCVSGGYAGGFFSGGGENVGGPRRFGGWVSFFYCGGGFNERKARKGNRLGGRFTSP